MRPVQLTMTAFGPYAEIETIDFSKLEGRSMFVVSGRTGAGKTTIFDAMTFALYGRASGALRNASDFRSQYATAELKTEVDFSFTIREERYRVVRQPQQPHPKNKTPIPHEAVLYEWEEGWKPVATKVNDVQTQVEDILQLSYEQFSQILLLPQNQFRQLLDSNSNEKQQILQSIFKTEAYRSFQENWAVRLSNYRKQVEWAVERTRLKLLELEDDQIEEVAMRPLDEIMTWLDEREQRLNEFKTSLEGQKEQLGEKLESARNALEEGKNVVQLFEEQEELKRALKVFEDREPERQAREAEVRQVDAASQVRPTYERLVESKKNVERLTQQVEGASHKLTDLKKEQERLEAEAESIERLKKERETSAERLRVIEELLPHLDERARLVKERKQAQMQAEELETFRQEARLTELHDQEQSLMKELDEEPKERAVDAERELDRMIQLQVIQKKQTELSARLEQCVHDGQGIKRQYEAQRDLVAQFEQAERLLWAKRLRETLVDGEACPVCGSTHHDDVRHLEKETSQKDQERATEELKRLEGKLYEAKADYRSLHRQLEDTNEEFTAASAGVSLKESLSETIDVLRKRVTDLQREESERLQKQRLARQTATELKQLEQQKRDQFEKRHRLLKQIESIQERLQAIGPLEEGSLADFKREQETLREVVRTHDAKMTAHLEQLEHVNKSAWKEEERLTLYKEQLVATSDQLASLQEEWGQKLRDHDLTSARYLELSGQIDQLTTMRERLTEEKEQGIRLRHGLQAVIEKLGDVERPDIASLNERVRQLFDEYELVSKQLVTAASELSRHRQTVREWGQLRAETAREEETLQTVKLIADTGKGLNPQKMTFETYVQTAFFDQILHAANQHLDRMTSGQFRLERKIETAKGNAKSGLELLVFDAYTGQSRRVQNLSGGEGFKASLSLALGLAEVVQQLSGGVSLETMLIDEGFGTLDSESLDQAIELLMSLQSSGRLVGVISHVQELKDRVDARIEVNKSRSGSTIQLIVE